MLTIIKVFIKFVIVLFLFHVFVFFPHKACGILVPWPGIEPEPCIRRQSFNYCTTWEVPMGYF